MVKDKGIVELVEAFKTVSKQVPHAKLLLVGPMEPELDPLPKETLNEIDANPAIMREGYVEDVRPYIDISHILVFPSYREGFPNVPMQAGCLEKALILSDINGCNELVQHGVNGQLVPTKRVSELVDSMLLYANDEELRKKHGKAIRETITEKYSQSYVWQELLNLYKSLT
jgi:glycosyltransferase involved in cell wall biosynthesis